MCQTSRESAVLDYKIINSANTVCSEDCPWHSSDFAVQAHMAIIDDNCRLLTKPCHCIAAGLLQGGSRGSCQPRLH